MEKRLAIIIPAYKITFFRQTLESIALQTNKRFTLYIGDDASPSDIANLVCEFKDRIDIVYKRFADNLGGSNLVAHWERCISMSEDEEWIWLFSDDDIMENTCIERFYYYIHTYPNTYDVLRFNTVIISNSGAIIKESKQYPKNLSSEEYYRMILRGGYNTFVVEYIFRRSAYLREDKIQKFDLAWGSDTASWIKFASNTGICSIDGPRVLWRYSGENISSLDSSNTSIVRRKIDADLEFIKWSIDYFKSHRINEHSFTLDKIKWVVRQLKNKSGISLMERINYIRIYMREMQLRPYIGLALFYFALLKIVAVVFRRSSLPI